MITVNSVTQKEIVQNAKTSTLHSKENASASVTTLTAMSVMNKECASNVTTTSISPRINHARVSLYMDSMPCTYLRKYKRMCNL